MSRQIKPYVTPEEYLALERKAEYKSEYLHGEIFAMTGASRKHNLITGNILGELHRQLKGKPSEVYESRMRAKVAASGLYTYPDVVVVCGDRNLKMIILIRCLTRLCCSKCFQKLQNAMTV